MPNTTTIREKELVSKLITLPEPAFKSGISIEESLLKRRSVREYKNNALDLKKISQLLWAAQGITSGENYRTAPSAGALYPLEIYLVSRNIKLLDSGVYHYNPDGHSLNLVAKGNKHKSLNIAALLQSAIKNAPAVIVIAAKYKQTTRKYFKKGKKFVHMEAGHAAQNICLQTVSLQLGTVCMGAFINKLVKQVLHIPLNEEPLYLLPIGISE